MQKEVLRLRNVHIGEDGYGAIKELDLLVEQGEILNLIGITGSGKTMLYKYFIGERLLNNGKVVFAGEEMPTDRKFAGCRDTICIGEANSLLTKVSIAENICIITRKRKAKVLIKAKNLHARVNFLLQQFVPELRADMKVEDLTKIQCHIIELLRAIENEAKLIYIDNAFELYGQMDLQRMGEVLAKLSQRGIAIVYASRRMDIITQKAKRIVVLRKGRNAKTFYRENFASASLIKWVAGNEKMLQFEKISYKNQKEILRATAVTGLDREEPFEFSVNQGEVVGFYDLNYTTNLKMLDILIGCRPLASGQLLLDGQEYQPRTLEEAMRSGVGYLHHLPAGSRLTHNMSFAENIALPIMQKMSILGLFRNRRLDSYLEKEYCDLLGISASDAKRPIAEFDAYVQMRIVLYKWLVVKPAVLVCEDICEETNIRMRNIIYEMLMKIAKEKVAIIIASQNLKELEEICDTIYVMNSYDAEHFGNNRIVKITRS